MWRAIDVDLHHQITDWSAVAQYAPAGLRWRLTRKEGPPLARHGFKSVGATPSLKNSCPHQAARVCLGRVVGTTLPSDVYEFRYGHEGRILRCPWHSWEYDITTGQSVFDPRVHVVTYPVEVCDGEIAVTIS